jgi:hypothetical protein
MRRFAIGVLGAVLALGVAASADASINYNASKSNTGNVTLHCVAHRGHSCVTHRRTHAATHGAHAGRRQHQPVTLQRSIHAGSPAAH